MRVMHRWSALGFLLLLALALAGVAGAQQKREVVFLYNWYGTEGEVEDLFQELVAEFEREHPDIKVEMIRGGTVANVGNIDRLMSLIAAGTPPDIVHFERSIVIEFAAKGYLRPLDDWVGNIEGEFVPGAVQEVVFKGKTYGIPSGTDIRGLFWNKDDLAEAGYDVNRGPATIEELDAMAQRLTRADGDGGFSRLGFIPWVGNWYSVGWLYTFGGNIFDPVNIKPRVNTPNHVRGYEWLQDYAQRYPQGVVAATFAGQTDTTLYGQRLSMIANWHGWANLVRQAVPTLELGVGEVPHPEGGSNGTWLGGQAYVVPQSARNPDDARMLLDWMTRKEVEVAQHRIGFRLPTRWSALAEIQDELSEIEAILLRQSDVAWGRPPLWHPPFLTAANAAQSKVISLQASPQAALDEAQRELEHIFADILGERE